MKTKPSKHAPEGVEKARTDRTDTYEGKVMARHLRDNLTGHRVMLWIYLEEFEGKEGAAKMRLVKHVEDLGEDAEVMARIKGDAA